MCGVSLKERIPSVELLGRLCVVSVAEVVKCGRLRWFGHIERKNVDDWVLACHELKVDSGRGQGRGSGRKTWMECISADMKVSGLKRADAQDRNQWRAALVGNRLTRASRNNVITDVKRE